MTAKIGVVRRGIKEEVLKKKFNIYLGISLNNKWFTKENIREYILWALKYTKSNVGVLVVDTLQSINYQVRSKYSEKAAIKKSLKEGDKIINIIKEIVLELPSERRKNIEIIRWDDITSDINYKLTLPLFVEEYNNNPKFRDEIKTAVQSFTENLPGEFSEEKIEKLGLYVINEMPELANGFTFNGTHYNCFIYPQDSLVTQLVEKIQKKEISLELYNKTNIGGNIFVELKL